ncbi:MAG: 1-acyl-sn-glycerol-3-phosphate acyltransferase [Myxococcales bacterium]|nr:1-acyl-sn-glycerol-3-phosphate acyltransferase [Myxococcales bacterium]
MRPEDRDRIQVEVVSRIVENHMKRARSAPEGYLETLVNDTLYHEQQRLKRESSSKRVRDDKSFYGGIKRRMRHASDHDLRGLIDEMSRHFVREVVGNFDDRVYKLSTSVIPTGLSLLLNAQSPARLFSLENLRDGLADHLIVQGEVDHVRGLLDHGTLVVVPTHSSNLDSPLLGYAAHLMGLPPLLYGAGLNLFTNPMISFFMRNLGAYRVDRKKNAGLYKEVLKEYATVAMEMGYHNLFFPGGTRSRSGAIEQHLKKGLLGTAVRAYVGNLKAKKAKPNIYVAPCTLSYKLVLEAETLIDDHLKEVGKSRYIISDDEFSRPRRIYNFFSNLVSLDAKILITFSPPLDLFGNPVNRQGESLDPHGRVIDPAGYVSRDGEPVYDDQRDHEYTNEVASEIGRAYMEHNVIQSTNLVAFSIFNLLSRKNPDLDVYRILRTGGDEPSFTMADVHVETERVLSTLDEMEAGPRLERDLRRGDIQEIVGDALKTFALYHTRPAARRRGDRVFHDDRNLLLYYGNRLRGYDLGRKLGVNWA